MGKTYSVSRARKEGEIISGRWPTLIDQHLFDRVQAVLEANRPGPGGAPTHEYVFSRLLVCTRCGRTMRALTNYGHVYYHCRRDIANPCPGASRTVREDKLLPWAEYLFEELDKLRPGDFTKMRGRRPRQAAESFAQIDLSLDRYQQMFAWGHINATEYKRHHDRLTSRREQLEDDVAPQRTIKLDGVHDAWKQGSPTSKRRLLLRLFEALLVRDGQIVNYRPRSDRAQEVVDLVLAATGGRAEVDSPVIRRPGQHGLAFASGGKGGIRTLEGALHPLPA